VRDFILIDFTSSLRFHRASYGQKKFLAVKYRKYILPDNIDFRNIARDEAIYRLNENKKMNCFCIEHMEEREKLGEFLKHFKIKKSPPMG
jgi:hypothetical protein